MLARELSIGTNFRIDAPSAHCQSLLKRVIFEGAFLHDDKIVAIDDSEKNVVLIDQTQKVIVIQ